MNLAAFTKCWPCFGRQLFDDDTDKSKNTEHEKEKASKGESGKFNDMQHNKGKKTEFNNGIRQGWRESYCSVRALWVIFGCLCKSLCMVFTLYI